MDRKKPQNNTIVLKHQDIYDLRKGIESLGTPSFDAKVFSKGVEVAAYYIKDGHEEFLDFSRIILSSVGDCIRPYLKSLYNGIRYCPGMEEYMGRMTSVNIVNLIDVSMINPNDDKTDLLNFIWKFAVAYIENSSTSLYDFAEKLIEKFGDDVRPYITPAYEAARQWFLKKGKITIWSEMDSQEDVDDFDSDNYGKPVVLKDRYFAPKNPGFLTITRHPGILEEHDILENLVLMDIMSNQLKKYGEVDARRALKEREEMSIRDLYEWANNQYSYFYDPEWEHVWERFDIYPNNATTKDGKQIQLYPLEEAFADWYSEDGELQTTVKAEDLMIEMLEDRFLQRFWEPSPE